MRKNFKKYTLIGLSLLLVLSNFSFATQHMLCLMSDNDDVKCECSCDAKIPAGQLILTEENSPCCQSNIIELTNNNNLQSYIKELPQDITSLSPTNIISDVNNGQTHLSNPCTSITDHIPRTEIPILISSLRI